MEFKPNITVENISGEEINKAKESLSGTSKELNDSMSHLEKSSSERIVNKENNIENKTIGPIFMVYRDNRNWEKFAPKIVEHIKNELGGDIEVMSFPRGTDEKVIEKWYEENKDRFEGKLLLTDNTCNPTIEKNEYEGKFNLDSILKDSNEETTKRIFKEAFGEKGLSELKFDSIEDIENSNTKIFKLALEKNSPKKVTFVESKFGHHSLFLVNLKGLQDRSLENDRQVLESFKKSLINAGYSEDNISVERDIGEPNQNEIESLKNEWFFIDSHNPMADEYRSKGLNVINPSEIADTVKPSNDEEIEKSIISGIDNKIKKIGSVEEFISIYGSSPEMDGDYKFKEIINKVGSEEKLMEIMNYLLDSNKNNTEWKEDEFWSVEGLLVIGKELINISEQSEIKIKKRIEEIMAQ